MLGGHTFRLLAPVWVAIVIVLAHVTEAYAQATITARAEVLKKVLHGGLIRRVDTAGVVGRVIDSLGFVFKEFGFLRREACDLAVPVGPPARDVDRREPPADTCAVRRARLSLEQQGLLHWI